jgi:hypothetical protein
MSFFGFKNKTHFTKPDKSQACTKAFSSAGAAATNTFTLFQCNQRF